MTRAFLIAVALAVGAPALAQEPVGCDKFKWSVGRERVLLASPARMMSGAAMTQALAAAITIVLQPYAQATLPVPPSRAPKTPDTFAGFIRAPAIPKPGTYRVTLSAPAWIDVVQNGQAVKSTAFSSASGCAGIAKSVKFDLAAVPFVVELSGATAREVTFVVTPD